MSSDPLLLAQEDEAIFSGYYIDWEYLQILVSALRPEFPERMAKIGRVGTSDDFVAEYDVWRGALSYEDKTRIPHLQLSFDPEDGDNPQVDPNRTRYFFPTRFVEADLDTCIEDYPHAMIEGEIDIARRDEMIALLKQHHDFELDISCLRFGCFMDDHPDVDPFNDTSSDTLPQELDDVIYSGYYVDWRYLQILVSALCPEFPKEMEKIGRVATLDDFAFEYDEWRRTLSEEDKIWIPQLQLSFDPKDKHETKVDPNRVRYFFPTRFVEAALNTCIDDYPLAMLEGEDDIACRDDMIAVLKRHNFEVDLSCLHFGCFKDEYRDIHPRPLTAGAR